MYFSFPNREIWKHKKLRNFLQEHAMVVAVDDY